MAMLCGAILKSSIKACFTRSGVKVSFSPALRSACISITTGLISSPVCWCSNCAACSNWRNCAIAAASEVRHSGCTASSSGSLSISSACSVAADTLRSTFDGCCKRSGVAVNSKIQEGLRRNRVSPAKGDPWLCASSTITKGVRRRITSTSECSPFCSGEAFVKCAISAPFWRYTRSPSALSRLKLCIVATMMVLPVFSVAGCIYSASLISSTVTAPNKSRISWCSNSPLVFSARSVCSRMGSDGTNHSTKLCSVLAKC